jgi:hypothetical protein
MNWYPVRSSPGFDRDGKLTGPTLYYCSHCGAGKGEEHKRECYVWSNKWRRGIEQTETNTP